MSTNELMNTIDMVSRDLLPSANRAWIRRKERHVFINPAAYGAAWSSTGKVSSQQNMRMEVVVPY